MAWGLAYHAFNQDNLFFFYLFCNCKKAFVYLHQQKGYEGNFEIEKNFLSYNEELATGDYIENSFYFLIKRVHWMV